MKVLKYLDKLEFQLYTKAVLVQGLHSK